MLGGPPIRSIMSRVVAPQDQGERMRLHVQLMIGSVYCNLFTSKSY